MEIKTRTVAVNYWAYTCPRCINGTMAWEKDKQEEPNYLKCILCGKEIRQNKISENKPKKSRKINNSEAKPPVQTEEKPVKKDYKWRFSHAQ